MNLKTIESIKENLKILKLETFEPMINEMLDQNLDLTFLEILDKLLSKEVNFKKERAARIGLKISNFPFIKRINDFDFDFQKGVNESQVLKLLTLNFIEKNENILLIGTPGVGKTHLSVAIGIEAVNNKKSTYFVHCHKLVEDLKKAHFEGRLSRRLKKFASYKLLIIDEVGYIPFDEASGKLLFQLISARCVKHPTIITTNLELDKWNKLFKDSNIGIALLDRLLERSVIIKIVGDSYRTKNIYNNIEGDLPT